MDQIRIRGGRPLKGEIVISGAKNAALPLMAASLLTDETLRPDQPAGPGRHHHAWPTSLAARRRDRHERRARARRPGRTVELTAGRITSTRAPYDLVRKMRASVLVLGPLLAREGHAEVSLPGGCAIGTRPVDMHLKGLELLGAEIELRDGYIRRRAPKGLSRRRGRVSQGLGRRDREPADGRQPGPGETRLINAAREPEVDDLAKCLIAMGARIEGMGSDTLVVEGVGRLHGAEHRVVADRIEAGTYAMAAAITGGEVELVGAAAEQLRASSSCCRGRRPVAETERGLKVARPTAALTGSTSMTEPLPRLSDRPAGPDDGADDDGRGRGR